MAQKTFACDLDNHVRTEFDGTAKQGCGKNKVIYAGRAGVYDYLSYLRFNLNWSDVGKINSAYLVVYTAGTGDKFSCTDDDDHPKIRVHRNKDGFSGGDNADEVWDSGDYTYAAPSTADVIAKANMTKAVGGLNRINITEMVEDWAPSTVKRHDTGSGGKAPNYGLRISGYSVTDRHNRWVGHSQNATDGLLRPYIELNYEYGPTKPGVPANLQPAGSVTSLTAFEADFSDIRGTDQLRYSEVEVYSSAVTNSGQTITLNGGKKVWSSNKVRCSNSEIVANRSNLIPSEFDYDVATTYKWRVRHYDQENQVSDWTNLQSFSVSNTAPNAPVLTPTDKTTDTLNGVVFRGTFSDPDGDTLLSYQIQLSAYPQGDAHWADNEFILWDSGRVYDVDDGFWETTYGGSDLLAGTYYLRARHWDSRSGVSGWTYTSVILTADFNPDPGTQSRVQVRQQVPWRIVIKAMHTNGERGPGSVVAILENAKSVGASKMYNSPGECHFTLPVDHPQISVIEPKQTHYSIQLWSGDGWREVFAGLVWDFDATETSVVFYGIDYLGLFQYVHDERFDPANIDKSYADGGSKYSNKTIKTIITDQLTRATSEITNSPTKFMSVGTIATMSEKVTIWSTMQAVLPFCVGLIDSHRQGQGVYTRMRVEKVGSSYQVQVTETQGEVRDSLRLRYGELVQGYRVIPFGTDWASKQHAIGRTREGIKVHYKSMNAPTIDQSIWGNIGQVKMFDGVSDENDLIRRAKQAAIRAGKIGKQVALGVRSGVLMPLDGYDICDHVPVDIKHGAVNTDNYGSTYYTIFGVAWEASDNGETNTTLSLLPREDQVAPDPDLIDSAPISTTPEWQLGWTPPPETAHGQYWLDQATGIVYKWGIDPAITDPNDPLYGIEHWYVYVPDQGINAGRINDGNLPGGSNLIPDGSFEMAAFPSVAAVVVTWDTDTDFDDSNYGSPDYKGTTIGGACSRSGTGTAAVIQLTSAT